MPTPLPEPDPVQRATRRRVTLVLALAVAFPAALLLLGETGRPELGFVLVAVALPVLFAVNYVRSRRTRENTDERAQENHRRAASVSWYAVTLALAAVTVWTSVWRGASAAEPYIALLTVSIGSYVATILTRRWRGL